MNNAFSGKIAEDSWFEVTLQIENSVVIKWTTPKELYKLPLTSLIVGIHKEYSINLPDSPRPCGTGVTTYYQYHTTSLKLNYLEFYSSYCICFYPQPLHNTYYLPEECLWKGTFESGESGDN